MKGKIVLTITDVDKDPHVTSRLPRVEVQISDYDGKGKRLAKRKPFWANLNDTITIEGMWRQKPKKTKR